MRGAIRVRRCRLRSTSGYTKLDGSAVLYLLFELIALFAYLTFSPYLAPRKESAMRKWLVGIGWLCVLWLAGCKDDGVGERLLARAEAVFATAPDSARALLDSIALPEELGDRSLTRWCTLYGRVADTLYIDLPYPEPFRQAYAYLRAHGTRREQARMGLYLGRAYAADKEYERTSGR